MVTFSSSMDKTAASCSGAMSGKDFFAMLAGAQPQDCRLVSLGALPVAPVDPSLAATELRCFGELAS
jgi:hypothetical protein